MTSTCPAFTCDMGGCAGGREGMCMGVDGMDMGVCVEWGVWVCLVQLLGEAAGVSPLKRHCFPS